MREATEVAADTTAAPVETSAPVEAEAVEAAESPVAADSASDSIESDEDASPSVFDWNGEVDGLNEAEWFSGLDENLQSAILKGLEAKYQNWQRGYTKAFGDNAERRKSLDSREQEIRDQEIRVQRWLHGDVDPLSEKQKEIDTLKESLATTVEQLKEEHAAALEAAKGADKDEFDKAVKELAETREQLNTILSEKAAAEEADLERRTDEFEAWLRDNEPDLMENDEAFFNLCLLLTGGAPLDQAVRMIRGAFPLQVPEPEVAPEPEPEPEPVPQSVSLMNMGTGQGASTAKSETRSARDVMDAMRRAAMSAEGGIFGGG